MTLSFDGKVAVITGAGGGLGRSHALELARRGAHVVVNDLGGSVDGVGGDDAAAQQVVDEITAAGGEAVPNYDSVATPEGGKNIIQTALDAWGKVDIVINNAGILRDTSFAKMTPEQLEPVLDVHLKGAFYVTQPAFVQMKEQGYGRIVNTASGAGIFGNFGQTNYGAAKMGLVGFTNVLAQEGAKYNIKANAIAPVAATRMTEGLLGPLADKLGPEYITPVAVFLAHESCEVSGEIYSCGGGRVARIFVGVTPGIVDNELSVESMAERLADIRNEDGYAVPGSMNDEMGIAIKALTS
jgi:NAD(P)-dependent dehydrogenase (short-subunit alcohol dehydrogenase family)